VSTCPSCSAPLPPNARFCIICGTALEREQRSLSRQLLEALGTDYEIKGELGRGGFGVVFLVSDRKNRRHLAVKVMHRELMASPAMVERFNREIRYASRLQHPNILSIAFSGQGGGLVYYAMPRSRGKSLNKLVAKKGPLPWEQTAKILSDVAAGLEHAHRQNVIHRDIKPSNIMVESGPVARILDFGIAKGLSTHESRSISISGELLGSPEYMSPEQSVGDAAIDHRTDIYSWGIVGYEMLAGKPPFTGKNVREVTHKHITETPLDLRTVCPDAPPLLAWVIHRSLEKKPAARWESIGAASTALRAVVTK